MFLLFLKDNYHVSPVLKGQPLLMFLLFLQDTRLFLLF